MRHSYYRISQDTGSNQPWTHSASSARIRRSQKTTERERLTIHRKSKHRHGQSSANRSTRQRKPIPVSFYQQIPEAPVAQPPLYPMYRRPQGWRSGYRPPSRTGINWWFFHALASLIRRSLSANLHTQLHPFISYASGNLHTVAFDIRLPPLPDYLPGLEQNVHKLDHLATAPAVAHLVIWHPKLPWYIRIYASSPYGVTVQDVLSGLYSNLRRPVSMQEYYTIELGEEDREMLTLAFLLRCGGDEREKAGGLRRVDFLGANVRFAGLKKGLRAGVWELKMEVPERRRMEID